MSAAISTIHQVWRLSSDADLNYWCPPSSTTISRPRSCNARAQGAVNIHPSLLPDLKGVDPVFFARLRGVAPLGVTLHRIVQDLDAGPVLAQARVDVAARDSVLAITARLFERGADLLLDKLDAILAGDPGVAQQGVGSYDSWPSSAQVARLRRAGGALVRATDLRCLSRGRRTHP